MKKILFPTDFSEGSKNAFIYALKLADSVDAEILTMHVYHLPQANYVNVAGYLHEIYDVTELSNFENYKDEVPFLRQIAQENNLEHIKTSHLLLQGNLITEIQKITEKESIDFVVMGTKGATGLKETFLGTVATKVMNDVKAIVLAVPEHCQYQPINKILFVSQLNPEDLVVLKKVMDFAAIFRAHIDCLRVISPHETDSNDHIENWEEIRNHAIVMHTVVGTDIEGIVLKFIDSNEINVLAMHVHHRNFFEKLFQISLSKKLAFHVNIPILAIHD